MTPLKIAVIGSGPSGFYAAEALLKQKDVPVAVDMFDRLPTPYGLVRGGVAPDHQKIKAVTAVYEKVAAMPGFRFFGNVKLGRDLTVADLRAHYDQIVYAVGAETDKAMGVPGENLPGSHSATEFVGWYNGHPDFAHLTFDLSQEAVAVVGIGNVAMDVTRILAEDPEKLKATDIAVHALEALRRSKVKTIYLLGRRGPAQAAYSPAEIAEIGHLESADLVVVPGEVAPDDFNKLDGADAETKKNVEFVREHAKKGEGSRAKKVRLRFLTSPAEITAKDGRVGGLVIELNKLEPDAKVGVKAVGTGKKETLPVGLVFRSVGYRGVAIEGVPFDDKSGKIPNDLGRVQDKAGGAKVPGEYVVGWAKRGPSGLIGTNRADSVATVKVMLEDAASKALIPGEKKGPESIPALLKQKGARFVSFTDWKTIDAAELSRGKSAGKIREKFTSLPAMLEALEKTPA